MEPALGGGVKGGGWGVLQAITGKSQGSLGLDVSLIVAIVVTFTAILDIEGECMRGCTG